MDGEQDAHEALSKDVEPLARHLNYPDPDQTPDLDSQFSYQRIISKEGAMALLDLLFKDRKVFLRAWSEAESPTLAGLLLVLRRRIHPTSTPKRWVRYVDIARRNYLSASAVANDPLPKFEEDIQKYPSIWYSGAPIAVDLEDARTQLSILTRQMSSGSNIRSSGLGNTYITRLVAISE
ncbi:hypothetical protein B0J17DRAFT_772655 [Rhizoctonia solani]|nr:hypothetical protein B0J17DRAFT_772655 [Rhizoctonia solani]